MRKTSLINKISSKKAVSTTKNMQVLDEQSKAYFNFINSLKTESTRKSYTFCIEKFLGHYEKDLDQFKKNKVFRLIIFNQNEIQAEINKCNTVRIMQDI